MARLVFRVISFIGGEMSRSLRRIHFVFNGPGLGIRTPLLDLSLWTGSSGYVSNYSAPA